MIAVLSVVSVILILAFRVLFMLAINYDCRAKNLKSTSLFTALAFFFPLIVGIVYACVRFDAEPNEKYCAACGLKVDGAAKICPSCNTPSLLPVPKENAKELAKTGVTLFIISVIVFVLAVSASTARTVIAVRTGVDIAEGIDEEKLEEWAEKFAEENSEDETTTEAAEEDTTDEEETDIESIIGNLTYYDRNGKGYKDLTEVPFYDRDGNIYLYQKDKDYNQYFIKKGSDKKLEFKKSFVDSDGYFVYDDKGEIKMENIVVGVDKDGNKYIPASLAIWNEKGELVSTIE